MGSFGERLRREREMRGISLDSIAESTKIGTRLLRALEEEQFELLPGGIFNKGFVRAYAKYLGLNEDEAVADYLIAAGESSLDPRVIAEQNDSRIDRSGGDTGNSRAPGFPIIPVLILLIVIAAGLGGWRIYRDRVKQRQAKVEASMPAVSPASTSATPTLASDSGAATANPVPPLADSNGPANTANLPGTATPGNTPASTQAKTSNPVGPATATGNSPAGGTPAIGSDSTKSAVPAGVAAQPILPKTGVPTGEPFEVTVRAKDHAWVSIKSDGKFAIRGIIAPPDVKTVRATEQVVFWTGNAGAVEISFNGQHVALEGGPNTAGTLVFNAHGLVIPKPAAAAREP
jgi:cytoskeleton protein RodZ